MKGGHGPRFDALLERRYYLGHGNSLLKFDAFPEVAYTCSLWDGWIIDPTARLGTSPRDPVPSRRGTYRAFHTRARTPPGNPDALDNQLEGIGYLSLSLILSN